MSRVIDPTFRVDDLSGAPSRDLVTRHLTGMHATSPPESVFALDIAGLQADGVTFWSGWRGDDIVVIGALKVMDASNGELKSMRVADPFLGSGAGRAILRHIVGAARRRGLATLWLETGNAAEFGPALRLYASEGFEPCAPFGDYRATEFSVFMRKDLVA